MKRFKKFMAGVIALAMVLGMVGVMPAVEAKAADITKITNVQFIASINAVLVEFDSADDTNAVNLYVGEAKNNVVKKYNVFEMTPIAATDLDVLAGKLLEGTGATKADKNGVLLDVSTYSKKGVELWIHLGLDTCNEETETAKIKIAKNDSKLKTVLNLSAEDASDNPTKLFEVKNKGTAVTDNLMFRTDNSTWVEFTDANVKKFIPRIEQFGSTIYFKDAGDKGTRGTVVTDAVFASAESKVKYPKLAKAPSVTVDYVKDIIKFPKGVEVKGIDKEANNQAVTAGWNEFTPSKDKATTVSIDKLLPTETPKASPTSGKVEAAFEFTVRVSPNGKKPGSAISVVKVAQKEAWVNTAESMEGAVAVAELNAENSKYSTKSTAAKKGVSTDISLTRIVDSKTNALKGIELKNNYDKQIEYIIADKGAPEPPADVKWTKVGVDATKKLPADAAGKKLFVRVAGNKGNAKKDEDPVRTSLITSITIQALITSFDPVDLSEFDEVYLVSETDTLKNVLPKTAVANLEDGTKVNVPVTWAVTVVSTNFTCTPTAAINTDPTLPAGVKQPGTAEKPDPVTVKGKPTT